MNNYLKLFGIFGHPLAHTLSPMLQEAGFKKIGLRAHYLVLDLSPPYFKRAMRSLKKSPLQGFNVTVPYKQTVMPYLDWMTKEAQAIGAVNTVYRFGKKWYGTNTDAEGVWLSLQKEWKWKAKGKNILVLGAGGAARAVLFALASRSVQSITVWNRTQSRRMKLISHFSKLFPKVQFIGNAWKTGARVDLTPFDLIVNTTSIGLHADRKSVV